MNGLYDGAVPKSDEAKGWTESEYAYENRSARADMETIRRTIEKWYEHYPDNDKDLRARFRSKDDQAHRGALFELYCHEVLLTCGYSVDLHPDLPRIRTHTDFLISAEREQQNKLAYFECRMVLEPYYMTKADNMRRALFQHLDDRFAGTGVKFFIDVTTPKERETIIIGPDGIKRFMIQNLDGSVEERSESAITAPLKTPSLNEIRQYFEKELAGITADIARKRLEGGFESEGIRQAFGDLHVTVVPLPIEAESGLIAMRPMPLVQQPEELIRNALEEKAGKYGDLPMPFVIALNTSDPVWVTPDIVERALYVGSGEAGWFNSSKRSHRVSAVAMASGLYSWNITTHEFELWHNPFANHPLGNDFWPAKQHFLDPSSNERRILQGKYTPDLLRLPPNSGLS